MLSDDRRQSANTILNRRYVLQGVIGQGGMGIVFQAYDRLNQRTVALKRVDVTSNIVSDESAGTVEQHHLVLANEFKLSATLRHPNIVEVFDYGFDDKRIPFFTMELLPSNQTITDAGAKFSTTQRLELFAQLAQAISYLHRRGIIHRDIKPANVIVVENQVKVLDFGLSGIIERNQSQSQTDDTLLAGTLAYMSPEVVKQQEATFASDLYALGILGYELLAGYHPFEVKNVARLLDQILHEMPDLDALDVDESVINMLFRLLQKDPQDRYADADSLLMDLTDILGKPAQDALFRDSLLQSARLIGRESQIQTLTEYFHRAQRKQGGACLIMGESGMGKSRLLSEFRTHVLVKDGLVVRAQAQEHQQASYAIWRPILRWFALTLDAPTPQELVTFQAILGDLSDLFPDEVIQQSSDLQFSHDALQTQLHSLLIRLIMESSQPIVVILEDVQWITRESAQLLQQLAQSAPQLPLLILATSRPNPSLQASFNDFDIIDLPPLTPEAIEAMSHAMLGKGGKSPQVIDLLQRETRGNAFLVVEVLRTLAHQFDSPDQIGRVTLSPQIFVDRMATFVEKYLENLQPKERELVYVAALMGREIDIPALSQLADGVDLKAWLIAKLNGGLLEVDDDVWQFAHDQILQRIITLIPSEQRPRIHQRIAQTIESTATDATQKAVILAYHWHHARVPEREERYATFAGEQYLKIGVYYQAMTYLERALELLPDLSLSPDRYQKKQVHIFQRLASAHLGLGNYDQAWSFHEQAHEKMQALQDRVGIAVCLAHLGDVALALNKLPLALELYQKSLAEYTAVNNLPGMARAYNQLGNIYYEMGDDTASREAFQQSLNISREIGSEWGMAGAMMQSRDATSHLKANYQAEINQLELQYELARKRGELDVASDTLLEIGTILHDADQHQLARDYYRRSLVLRQTLGQHPNLGRLSARIAMLDVRDGLYEQAEKRLAYALRILEDSQAQDLIPYIYYEFAHLFYVQGDYDTMLELFAYLLNAPQTPESVQDASERLINDLSQQMDISHLEPAWERGKLFSHQDLLRRFARSDT